MQKSNSMAVIGLIVFGIIAVGLTIYALTAKNSPVPPRPGGGAATEAAAGNPAAVQTYYVASRQILPRTRITRDMLLERQADGSAIPQNAVTNPSQIIGKLANDIIEPGQTLTENMALQPVARVIPANIPVPPGLRAVAVWVNPQETAAGLVDVGDRVDVLSTNKLQGKTATIDSIEFVSGRTIAQDLQVLAVDRSIESQPANPTKDAAGTAAPAAPSGDNADGNHTRVILAATTEQAQRITAANEAGTIHLVIRNPADTAVVPTREALEYPVHLVAAKPATAPPPPSTTERVEPQKSVPASAPRQQYPVMPRPNISQTAPAMPTPPPSGVETSPLHEITVIRGTEKSMVGVPK